MELHSNSTLKQLIDKLPPYFRSRWGERSWAMQPNIPNVADLDAWLDDVAMAEYCIRGGVTDEKRPNEPAKARQRPSKPSVFSVSVSDPGRCPVCDNDHLLKDCNQFKDMSVDRRVAIVKDNRLCYRCLNKEHLSPDCKRNEPCGNGDCGRLHHPLLHGAPRMYPRRRPPVSTTRATSPQPFSSATAVATESVTMLPIVPVVLTANGRKFQTFALLDSGSEVTLVEKGVIEKLGVDGREDTMAIVTVTGSGRPVKSKRVEFVVESTDGANVFEVAEARVVDSINLKNARSICYPFELCGLICVRSHFDRLPRTR